MAYWISVLFLLGSILFAFNAALYIFQSPGGKLLRTWPNLFGAIGFTVGCYFMYLQMINIATSEAQRLSYIWTDWSSILSRAAPVSCIGTLAYFIGALLFQVACVAILLDLNDAQSIVWVSLPSLLGSVGFVIGGVCEVKHNHVFDEELHVESYSHELAWWASLGNLVGGTCFLLGCLPVLIDPSWSGRASIIYVHMGFFVGSCCFAVTSILRLLMWRANDFGLTLLNQLNQAVELNAEVSIYQGSNDESVGLRFRRRSVSNANEALVLQDDGKLSIRGVTFIVLYCWFICIALIDVLIEAIWYKKRGFTEGIFFYTGIGMHCFTVCAIFMVLLMHSVVTQVPSQEPWRFAFYATRVIMVLGMTCVTIDVFAALNGWLDADASFSHKAASLLQLLF